MKNKQIPDKNKRITAHHKPASIKHKRLSFRDFSAIEDHTHAFELIHRLANNAGIYAAAEAKARGLGTAYVRGNQLVKISAQGKAVVISPRFNRASFYVKYNPSTILHAIKR